MEPAPLLIVKTGSSSPTLDPSFGDFEDWIRGRLGKTEPGLQVVNVEHGETLPSASSVSGAIVTGSSAMVTDRLDWSERTAEWLVDAIALGQPVLGICYGHQLLAHALGGRVAANPNGREIGTISVQLNSSAASDVLFSGLPSKIEVQETHVESVVSLPDEAVRLAASELDPNQAFRVGNHAWGVQFHPEFSAAVTSGYLTARRAAIEAEGIDVDRLLSEVRESPVGEKILSRFGQLVSQR